MKLIVESAWKSLAKSGEELCGDRVNITSTPTSAIIVLSDGLGSGVKANILASLTARIASSMFEQGANVEQVIETMIETLPECQVRKLAYATLSVLKVIDGREAYLVEYDNPPLVLIRDNEIVELPRTEREIHGRKVKEAQFQLRENDYMAMFSDGYVHAGVGGLYKLGWGWNNIATSIRRWVQTGGDAHGLTQALASTCLKLYGGKPGDDATVVGMRVRQAIKATVLTGPPSEKALDAPTVSRLMAADGQKVICGGTTAQVAARVLNKELQVEWLPPSKRRGRPTRKKGTPPTAKLEGVDLVTEGILTLGQTVELLAETDTVHDLPPEHDAATQLARILLTADQIHLLVGMAINPNQVADLVRGEPMRMLYIKELVRMLEGRHKEVVLEQI